MERELCALPHRSCEQEEGGEQKSLDIVAYQLLQAGEVEGPVLGVEYGNAGEEKHIPDPRDQEGLLGCCSSLRLLVPEPDEKVGAQPHQLPEYEHKQEIIGQHQAQHGADEERDYSVVPPFGGVVVHVAQRVNSHHR